MFLMSPISTSLASLFARASSFAARPHLNIFEYIWIYLNRFEYIWINICWSPPHEHWLLHKSVERLNMVYSRIERFKRSQWNMTSYYVFVIPVSLIWQVTLSFLPVSPWCGVVVIDIGLVVPQMPATHSITNKSEEWLKKRTDLAV